MTHDPSLSADITMSVVIHVILSADNVGMPDTQPDIVGQQNNIKMMTDIVG